MALVNGIHNTCLNPRLAFPIKSNKGPLLAVGQESGSPKMESWEMETWTDPCGPLAAARAPRLAASAPGAELPQGLQEVQVVASEILHGSAVHIGQFHQVKRKKKKKNNAHPVGLYFFLLDAMLPVVRPFCPNHVPSLQTSAGQCRVGSARIHRAMRAKKIERSQESLSEAASTKKKRATDLCSEALPTKFWAMPMMVPWLSDSC